MFFIQEESENERLMGEIERGDVVTFSFDQISRRDVPTNPQVNFIIII